MSSAVRGLSLHFSGMHAGENTAVGPHRAIKIAGNFMRALPADEIIACYVRHQWQVRGRQANLRPAHTNMPPEISMRWPVIQRVSSASSAATAGPMSSGTPARPSAVTEATKSLS